eukprot:880826-Rhodomonas_salina.2
MRGTDVLYGATRGAALRLTCVSRRELQVATLCSYAHPTQCPYDPMHTLRGIPMLLHTPYAVSGTDIGYGCTRIRCRLLTSGMVVPG